MPTLSFGFSASTVCTSYPYATTYNCDRDTLMALTGLCKLFVLLYFLLMAPFCQKGHAKNSDSFTPSFSYFS